MKAYQVQDIKHSEGWSDIIFAESAKEAKKRGFGQNACEDAEWINVRVNRIKEIDGMQDYDKKELDYELIKIGWCFEYGDFSATEENIKDAVSLGYVRKRLKNEV